LALADILCLIEIIQKKIKKSRSVGAALSILLIINSRF